MVKTSEMTSILYYFLSELMYYNKTFENNIKYFLYFIFKTQRNRVRSAGGTINSGSRNDSKIQLHGSTSISNDDEQQQQLIQPTFSQQLICNPKILLIQG